MRYYIDFDNTLFDTERFYKDLLEIVKNYNISENKINEYYYKNSDNKLFNPLKIINKLIENHKLKKEIIKELDLFLNDISVYLYNDTIEFLEYLNSKNYEIILLTYGDYDYQNEKIEKTFIKDYFNKIIITSLPKANLDLDYKNSIFIDDNEHQLKGLIKKDAKVIRIRRNGNKHSINDIKNVLEFENFNEYLKSIK